MSFDASGIRAVAFDLDGTLVDSAADIGHAVNTALVEEGLQGFELDRVRTWIGDGPDALIARALEAQDVSPLDEGLRLRLRQGFERATLASPLGHGALYPGITDLVRQLHRRFPLAVITNKPTVLARAVLEAAGLLPYFAQVRGADTLAQRKPEPFNLLATATAFGVVPSSLLMVGDAPPDMLAAHAAGCPSALACWGYGAHAVPDHLKPWRVSSAQQIADAFAAASSAPRGTTVTLV
jgi:phosphoglycolate phosphatase